MPYQRFDPSYALLLALAAVGGACAADAPPHAAPNALVAVSVRSASAPDRAAPSSTAALAGPDASGSSSTRPIAAAPPSAAEPRPAPGPPPPGPGRIGCGQEACDAKSQSCCVYFDEVRAPACVPLVPELRGAGLMAPEWPLVEACTEPTGATMELREVARCDASADCPPPQRCCADHLGREHLQRRCSAKTCELSEVCTALEPCVTPGTRCSQGVCVKVGPVACAGAICAAPDTMCCASEESNQYACRPPASCLSFIPRIECTRPADCPSGQDCVLTQGNRAECNGGQHDTANTRVACSVDRDCAHYACPRGARCVGAPSDNSVPPGVAHVCECR